MKKQDFKVLKTKDLYPFPDNPFHVAEDETLSELAESIKEFGIISREYVGTQTVTEAFVPIISEDIRKKIAEGDTFDNEGLSA